jgi:hypothetical protein
MLRSILSVRFMLIVAALVSLALLAGEAPWGPA